MLRSSSPKKLIAFTFLLVMLVTAAAYPIFAQDNSEEDTRPTGSYTIQQGDVLDVLAQRWDVSLQAIMQANDLSPTDLLHAGDVIIIPADAPAYGVYPARPDDSSSGRGGAVIGDIYVVQPRDTLDTIAQRLDVSAVAIQQANEITNSRGLTPGTVLVIPADAPGYGLYPALRTDPSQSVTSAAQLGQGGGGVGPNQYVIQRNDTMDVIAANHNVQTQCLIDANNLENPKFIYPGQVLDIDRTCPPYDGFDFPGND